MKILACYNVKGGVGKTATAVNLAYLAARTGWKVLIWDLDPQGATSFYFKVQPKKRHRASKIIGRKENIEQLIMGTDYANLDLIPADFSYRKFDIYLNQLKKPLTTFRKILKPIGREYDYIIFDCPPGITVASETIFNVADVLVIPLIPTTLSLRTLQQLIDFHEKRELERLQLLPFFSMVDIRKGLHRAIVKKPPLTGIHFLKSYIPYASDIEQMGIKHAPLLAYAPSGKSAQAYQELWVEITRRLRE